MDWKEARAVPKSFTGGLRLKLHCRPSPRGRNGTAVESHIVVLITDSLQCEGLTHIQSSNVATEMEMHGIPTGGVPATRIQRHNK
ncbi:hypothetical protein F2Q70_00035527 [Brassica cretica]|uniref:Uncharacterized protein n=1 Tax=Brassica cretica TaxID=69181 RepID=A0A8S9JYH9_BRACR|nr:hypothetical protein F2Q70_00035527 [Brassica cretica]